MEVDNADPFAFINDLINEDGNGVKATLEGKKPINILLADYCQSEKDVDAVIKFHMLFKNMTEAKEVHSALFQYMGSDMFTKDINKEEILETLKIDRSYRRERLETTAKQYVPVTPFNFASELGGHPSLKALGPQGDFMKYDFMGDLHLISTVDNQAAFTATCNLLVKVKDTVRRKEHVFKKYDMFAENAARAIVLRYEVAVTHGQITMTVRKGFSRPPDKPTGAYARLDAIADKFNQIIDAIAKKLDGVGTIIPSSTKELDAVYWTLTEIPRDTLLTPEQKILFDNVVKAANTERTFYSNGETKEEEKRKEIEAQGFDDLAPAVKDVLTEARTYRKKCEPLDDDSHDACMRAPALHLHKDKWGTAHSVAIMADMLQYAVKHNTKVKNIVMAGSGADDMVDALTILDNYVPDWGIRSSTVSSYVPGKPDVKPGANVIPCSDANLIPWQKVLLPENNLVILVKFSEQSQDSDKNNDGYKLFIRQTKNKSGVFAFQYNMSDSIIYAQLLNEIGAVGKLPFIWRHPRLHNDSFYIVFSDVQPFDGHVFQTHAHKCVLERIRLHDQVVKNNMIRNWSTYFGVRPRASVDAGDSSVNIGIATAYAMAALGRSVSKKAKKRAVARDNFATFIQKDNIVVPPTPDTTDTMRPESMNPTEPMSTNNNDTVPPQKHPRLSSVVTRQSGKNG